MVGPDEVAELEGEALAFWATHGMEPEQCLIDLCQAATGSEPIFEARETEGHWDGGLVRLSVDLHPRRARHVLGHELGHVWLEREGRFVPPNIEERCDVFGAILNMPRAGVRHWLKQNGHAFVQLAEFFGVTQSVALLRIGEVTGRPVMLLRERGPIVRGFDFGWPSRSPVQLALGRGREVVHLVQVRDEPQRVGIMASRSAWESMAA